MVVEAVAYLEDALKEAEARSQAHREPSTVAAVWAAQSLPRSRMELVRRVKKEVRGLVLTVGTSANDGVLENLSPVRLPPFARIVSSTESAFAAAAGNTEVDGEVEAEAD